MLPMVEHKEKVFNVATFRTCAANLVIYSKSTFLKPSTPERPLLVP